MSYKDATPRPWTSQKARTMIHIGGANGRPVTGISVSPPRIPERDMREANVKQAYGDAELIVRAVNNHEPLVDALTDCVRLLEFLEPDVKGGYSPDGALAKARALLETLKG